MASPDRWGRWGLRDATQGGGPKILAVATVTFATRPVIAKALSRWGHILLPAVLILVGLLILIGG